MVMLLAGSQSPVVPRTQDALVDLWSGDAALPARELAVAQAMRIPHEQRSEALQRALAKELVRVNDLLKKDKPPIELYGYQSSLLDLVRLSMVAPSLTALVGDLGHGWNVIRGVAKFGEEAVAPLVAATGSARVEVSTDAIRALQVVFEASRYAPLSERAKAQIVSVARERLFGRQNFLVVAEACGLAASLGDAQLKRRVEQLISDPSQAAQMGITEREFQFMKRVIQMAMSR